MSAIASSQNFPMGIGKGWERFLQEYVSNCDTQLKHVIALRSRDDKMSHHAVTTNQKVGDNGDAPAGATKEHPRMSKATKTIVNTKNDALHTPWLKGYMEDKKMFNTGIATARNKAKYVTDTDVIGDMDSADDIHTVDGPERNRRRFYRWNN